MSKLFYLIINLCLIIFLLFSNYNFKYKLEAKPFYTLNQSYNQKFNPNQLYYINYYIREDILASQVKETLTKEDEDLNLYIETKERFKGSYYQNAYYDIIELGFYLSKPLIVDAINLRLEYHGTVKNYLLGSFRISNKEDNSLDYNYLEIFYQYQNNNLLPIGVGLSLNKELEITQIKLNHLTYGNLGKSSKNIPKSTIIASDIAFHNDFTEGKLKLKPYEKVFIPFYYKSLNLACSSSLIIEADKKYYLNLPIGLISFKRLCDYPSFIVGGLND